MADPKVEAAQRFINSYDVEGIPTVEENGKTSWTVMRALTRILQFHLGITSLSDSFGPGTLAALQANYPNIDESNIIAGINRVIQSALYCKGYDGGEIDGVFNSRVGESVREMKGDMGVSDVYPGSGVTPKVFKSLLTMDAYVTVLAGTETVREVQRWMNGKYALRRDFYIIPADGNFSRDVQKGLMLAIQFQIGMADGVANGVFGPATQTGIRNNVLNVGSSSTWVRLFTAALVFNERSGAIFADTFSAGTATVVNAFQAFVKLPITGKGDFPTWASLLVSYGDNTRRGSAGDASTTLTSPRITSLRAAGFNVIGRYLCNTPGSSFNKMIQPGELTRCEAAGFSVFPIYQTVGTNATYFSHDQGVSAAFIAVEWARFHGFRSGTRIYFAVDFDALDDEVTDNVIPYFRGIDNVMTEFAREYAVGIYGARNVCSRVGEAGMASASFVLDMSSGYSGNLGYSLPDNWAFDQISTITVGSGEGSIQIDNNIASGVDSGQKSFLPQAIAGLDTDFDQTHAGAMLEDVRSYMATLGYGDTGSPDLAGPFRLRSTQEAFENLMNIDSLITSLARSLRMRKALTQAVLFQEMRHLWEQDTVTDAAVIEHYDGTPLPSPMNDCSTGLGQIYAATAIESRNYCIGVGIVGGLIRDSENEDDLWSIWQRLHSEDIYNVSTIPLVLIAGAAEIGVPRPSLVQSDGDAERIISRYNGFGEAASEYGRRVIGYYRIFESYNAFLRNA